MSWIERYLTRLEAQLKAIIEGDAARDGISRKFYNLLMDGLIQAAQADLDVRRGEANPDSQSYTSPDQYTLVLPPEQAQLLLTHPVVLDRLANKLQAAAGHLNITFPTAPILRVVADPEAQALKVVCAHSQAGQGNSMTVELNEKDQAMVDVNGRVMPQAYLIVNGLSTFHLTQAVINVGSDPNNQLVLQHPGVSRLHAQLRFTTGRFAIFDLDSREGIFVNGVSVTSHWLNPGDVIVLAGLPLIYGEETMRPMGHTQELPAEPLPPEVM